MCDDKQYAGSWRERHGGFCRVRAGRAPAGFYLLFVSVFFIVLYSYILIIERQANGE
jgi:hypothetical protein